MGAWTVQHYAEEFGVGSACSCFWHCFWGLEVVGLGGSQSVSVSVCFKVELGGRLMDPQQRRSVPLTA